MCARPLLTETLKRNVAMLSGTSKRGNAEWYINVTTWPWKANTCGNTIHCGCLPLFCQPFCPFTMLTTVLCCCATTLSLNLCSVTCGDDWCFSLVFAQYRAVEVVLLGSTELWKCCCVIVLHHGHQVSTELCLFQSGDCEEGPLCDDAEGEACCPWWAWQWCWHSWSWQVSLGQQVNNLGHLLCGNNLRSSVRAITDVSAMASCVSSHDPLLEKMESALSQKMEVQAVRILHCHTG